MIRTIARRKGLSYAVACQPRPGQPATTRTFSDQAAAEAFDSYANARWSLAPLVEACGYDPDSPSDLEDWADAHGVSSAEIGYALRDGGFCDQRADQLATGARLHPAQVWGPAWITTGLALEHIHPEEPAA